MIVCGKLARWWDSEVKYKINSRRKLYKSMLDGNVDAWEDYCKLRKEVKDLIQKKKIGIWNNVVEKGNTDYEGCRKEFWAFVGRRTKGKKKAIGSLRSDKGVSVTSTRGTYVLKPSTISDPLQSRNLANCTQVLVQAHVL